MGQVARNRTSNATRNGRETKKGQDAALASRRNYLSQSDVPRHSIDDALRVAAAINDEYGKKPTRPVDVAKALNLLPTTGQFRSLTGAALAYGLTDGGPNADSISLTDLGLRAVSPTEEGDDLAAKREALLRPRVVREFLEKYDGSKLPSAPIGKNVLELMGVPREKAERTLALIVKSGDGLGLLTEINGQKVVNIRPTAGAIRTPSSAESIGDDDEEDVSAEAASSYQEPTRASIVALPVAAKESLVRNRRVYISHGSNKKVVAQLKELLTYGDFEPVVSEEKETTAKPVPEKVLGEMRSCGAGIIHVGAEQTIIDKDGNEHSLFNYNVLIEIGAAMALYGANYILLVEEGTQLPSNLQGLYEARYKGEALDHDATMKLLRTLKEFKS